LAGTGRPLAEGLRRPNSFGAPRAKRRPSPTQATFLGRRRPSVGRRPSRRLKSAFPGAMRQASAFADASDVPRSAQAGRWPKAFSPIEIGLLRRLRARRRPSPAQATFLGRRRPSVGRRPSRRLKSAFPGATRQASAFADAESVFRSAQAGRWPKAFPPIEIGLLRRLRAGRRPSPTQRAFFGRRRPAVG